jgi:hypothetical protein
MDSKISKPGLTPLPEHLRAAAYFTPDGGEWALPKKEALGYLDWCQGQDLKVLGFEVWYPLTGGPMVLELGVGNVEGIEANRESILKQPERDVYSRLVFNFTVVESAHRPTAG